MNDLILLVADKNMQFALQGALSRPEALGICGIEYKFLVHPERDGGVRTSGAEMLRLEQQMASHALLVMDFEGSGSDAANAIMLEQQLDKVLHETWGDAAKAIVIEPELDIWMWGSDNALQEVIRWSNDFGIRDWLRNRGFQFMEKTDKPIRPKEAIEAVLRDVGLPRSSATYEKIARKISLKSCTDPAFIRLRAILQQWFPSGEPTASRLTIS